MTEQTNNIDSLDSLDDLKFTSIRALAAAIERSPSTALEWTRHPAWPFARSAPWNVMDLPEMIVWADENLRRDREEDLERMERRERRNAREGFWNTFDWRHDSPLDLGGNNYQFSSDLPTLPATVATPAELALLADGQLPDAATIREIIGLNILARARLAGLPHYLPQWLRNVSSGEARDRMAAAINEHVCYAAEAIGETLEPKRPKRRK